MSLLTSMTRPSPVLAHPWDQATDFGSVSTGAFTANTLYLVRAKREPLPRTISAIELYFASASGNADVGMWSFDGTTLTLLSSSGSTALSGAATWQALPLGAAQTKRSGLDYFYGVTVDNGTVNVGRAVGTTFVLYRGYLTGSKASAFPLASNAASITATDLVGTAIIPALRAV